MLVTRTETYTDWIYQGAHSNEVAATVGRGLLEGHIYFRYTTDFLREGERLVRSRSFITLSDGTSYELGAGEVAHKVNVTYHGLTSGGEVYIEVHGVDGSGVGVSSISRHVIIEYDDGKTPILDEDQLKIVLAELSDDLTGSMVDTANTIKQEFTEKVNTMGSEISAKCKEDGERIKSELQSSISGGDVAVKEEIKSEIETVKSGLEGKVQEAGVYLTTNCVERTNKATATMEGYLNKQRSHHAQWTIGKYTVNPQKWKNLTHAAPEAVSGESGMVTHNGVELTFVMASDFVTRQRELRVSCVMDLEFPDSTDDITLIVALMDSSENITRQKTINARRTSTESNTVKRVQADLSLPVDAPADNSQDLVLANGLRLGIFNFESRDVVVKNGSTIQFSLI